MKLVKKISAYLDKKDIKLRLKCFLHNRKVDATILYEGAKKLLSKIAFNIKWSYEKRIKPFISKVAFNIKWSWDMRIRPFLMKVHRSFLVVKANLMKHLANFFYIVGDICVDAEEKALTKLMK